MKDRDYEKDFIDFKYHTLISKYGFHIDKDKMHLTVLKLMHRHVLKKDCIEVIEEKLKNKDWDKYYIPSIFDNILVFLTVLNDKKAINKAYQLIDTFPMFYIKASYANTLVFEELGGKLPKYHYEIWTWVRIRQSLRGEELEMFHFDSENQVLEFLSVMKNDYNKDLIKFTTKVNKKLIKDYKRYLKTCGHTLVNFINHNIDSNEYFKFLKKTKRILEKKLPKNSKIKSIDFHNAIGGNIYKFYDADDKMWGEYLSKQQNVKDIRNAVRKILDIPELGCRNKTELMVFKSFRKRYPELEIVSQWRPDWLGRQSIDIAIPQLSIAIECDGRQHYIPIERFGGEEKFIEQKERDKLKNALCKENKIKLFRIRYDKDIDKQKEKVFKYIDKVLKSQEKMAA